MTRIYVGGTLAKEAMPKMNAGNRSGELRHDVRRQTRRGSAHKSFGASVATASPTPIVPPAVTSA